MRFSEINLFGVYVAPICIPIIAAWMVIMVLRRVANRYGLLGFVWHPALFVLAIYVIVLSSIVLLIAR